MIKKILILLSLFLLLTLLTLPTLFLGLNLYLTPDRIERLVINNLNSPLKESLSFKVKDFNLFKGFSFEDISLKTTPDFGAREVIDIKKITFRYNLLAICTGEIHFPKVTIINPKIYLEQKDNRWNFNSLLAKNSDNKLLKNNKNKGSKPNLSKKSINLPIEVNFFLDFLIKNLEISIKTESLETKAKGIFLNLNLATYPTKQIDPKLDLLYLLKNFNLTLNPSTNIQIQMKNKDFKTNFPLNFRCQTSFLNKNKNRAKSKFKSELNFEINKAVFYYKKRPLAPLNLKLGYNLLYKPDQDNLKLDNFIISWQKQKLINLAGEIKKIRTKPNLNLAMKESYLNLNSFSPYLKVLGLNKQLNFKGAISLFPLKIAGESDNLEIKGGVNLKQLNFSHQVIKSNIPKIIFNYDLDKKNDNLNLNYKLNIPFLTYSIKKEKSGQQALEIKSTLSFSEQFKKLSLHNFSLKYFNPKLAENREALNLLASADLILKPNIIGSAGLDKMIFKIKPLLTMLPPSLRKKIPEQATNQSLTSYLDLNFRFLDNSNEIEIDWLNQVPEMNLNDLMTNLYFKQNKFTNRIDFQKIHLGSKNKKVSLNGQGWLDLSETPLADSNLNINLKYNPNESETIINSWSAQGLINLRAKLQGDLKQGSISGTLETENLNITNPKMKFNLKKMDLDFPFEYYFKVQNKPKSQITISKSQVIDNPFFEEKSNFTIKSLTAKHPIREAELVYLKNFSAVIFFKDNIFRIKKIKSNILSGSFYGEDLLFNLADRNLKNMEYKLDLNVTNVDIGQLDETKDATKNQEAVLSFNANFSGQGLDRQRGLSPKGYVNIYKIGDKFANRLMKGLSTEKGKSKLGSLGQFVLDNSMQIKSFNFNLDKGLIYTTVTLSREALGYLIGVENNKIKFDRIPIHKYLKDISKGE